MVSSPLV